MSEQTNNLKMEAHATAGNSAPQSDFDAAVAAKLAPLYSSKYAGLRRSQRVHLRKAVIVYGMGPNGTLFGEHTHTSIVNANGALVSLARPVQKKDRLLLVCRQTQAESECVVAWIGDEKDGKRDIGLGFVEPAPQFWGLNFPPDDWDLKLQKHPTGMNP